MDSCLFNQHRGFKGGGLAESKGLEGEEKMRRGPEEDDEDPSCPCAGSAEEHQGRDPALNLTLTL